jgi:Domain of unknown function (DUF4382)/Carboxypeptidase regulatory-like domain
MHGSQPEDSVSGPSSSLVRPLDVYGGIGGSRLNLMLGDASPRLGNKKLSHVNLGIREIDAVSNGTTYVLAQYKKPKVVDVLSFQNDNGDPVANASKAQTTYQQVRFVVDLPTSQVVFNGNDSSAINFLTNTTTFSSVHAGANTTTVADGPGAVDITVNQPFSLPSDGNPDVRIDFNLYESLAMLKNESVIAEAALFVAPRAGMGSISGTLENARGGAVSNATVVAVASDGSIGNTTCTDANGNFTLGTLRSGTYQLVIYNQYTTAVGQQVNAFGASSGAQSVTGPSVTVTGGQTTTLGNIAD